MNIKDNFTVKYDNLADTLYISIKNKYKATNAFIDDNFIIVRKNKNVICGITIDGYKDRLVDKTWNDNLILNYLPQFDLYKLKGVKVESI